MLYTSVYAMKTHGALLIALMYTGTTLVLAGLAVLEHLFMALPVKDATLWNWMLPNLRKSSDVITLAETKSNFPKESKNELR